MDSSPGDLRCHNAGSARLSSGSVCCRNMLDMCVKRLFHDDLDAGESLSMQENSTDDIVAVHETCISRLLDSPNDSPQLWDMSFATPGATPESSNMSVDPATCSPPPKHQRLQSPLSATVPLSPSPLKFSLHMKPMNLEREFFSVSSPPRLSSPPNLERLRLFDTPHTPRSLVRRSSASSKQFMEKAIDSHSIGLSRPSRMVRSGPQLRRHQSKGTNINPFTPRETSYGKRARDTSCEQGASCQHKQLALRESNIYRFREEFHEVCVIGAGSFGTVYKCINRLDGCMYALKRSHKPVAGSADEVQALREVYAHAVLGSHPHLVRYYSAWAEDNHMLIQNEFCNGGNLSKMIEKYEQTQQTLNETQLKRLIRHVAKGLQYINSMGLVHLDIKPENIFVCNPEAQLEATVPSDVTFNAMEDCDGLLPVYKIGDMGHVTSLNEPRVEEGDCRFMPRELLQEDYSELQKVDIFCLGLTVFCAGSLSDLPKNGPDWQKIRDGFLPPLTQCSTSFNHFILSLVSPIPSDRPSASSIVTHQLICLSAEKTKAQLKKELNEEKLKNETLSRALQQLKQDCNMAESKKHYVGGSKNNRTMSLGDLN